MFNRFVRWLDALLNNMFDWLDDHAVISCFQCRRLIFKKDSFIEIHNVIGSVRVCEECENVLYHPFTGGKS